MLKELRKRLGFGRQLARLRLAVSEFFLPKEYYVQMRPVYASSGWEREHKTYSRLHDWPHLRDGNRVLQAHLLLRQVHNLPEGDYAELGTYRGNYGRLIYSRMVPGARFYCFDTFEGFDDRDLKPEARASGIAPRESVFADTSLRLVEQNITAGAAADRLVFRKGFFPDTFSGLEGKRWRFVLPDADLYAPIKAGLEIFWPQMAPGGVILVHDYLSDYFEGAKIAVDEFCGPRGISVTPWPDRVGSAVLIKPPSIASAAKGTDAAAVLADGARG